MRRGQLQTAVLLSLLAFAGTAQGEVESSRFEAAGYFRVMTRPDFQGGDSKLGFWNLYGRLLNEGPYAALELRLHLLQENSRTNDVWTRVHAKIEGGSIANADSGGGELSNFRLTQLYAQAGNVLVRDVTWQLGTLDTYLGDLGLYDMKLAQLFYETVGLSARYLAGPIDFLVGAGDAGFFVRGRQYSTVLTGGAMARIRIAKHAEFAVGGQYFFEPEVEGNRYAPYETPGVLYEDFVRGEIVERFLEQNPGMEDFFPDPVGRSSVSYKGIAYFGFGGFGPLRWSGLQANFLRRHPDNFVTENVAGRDYDIFVAALTDERFQLNIGNEAQLTIIPDHLDAIWSVLFGHHWDRDNEVKSGDDDRTFYSTVLRLQNYLSPEIHLLAETSLAHEKSEQGNLYRNHVDSVFDSTSGVQDPRGLEFGDSSTRTTWQGKLGVVLNPLGMGIYTRPSLRLLYGIQHSSQNNAFGNNFVESLDDFNQFPNQERHIHHVIALEAEAWF